MKHRRKRKPLILTTHFILQITIRINQPEDLGDMLSGSDVLLFGLLLIAPKIVDMRIIGTPCPTLMIKNIILWGFMCELTVYILKGQAREKAMDGVIRLMVHDGRVLLEGIFGDSMEVEGRLA